MKKGNRLKSAYETKDEAVISKAKTYFQTSAVIKMIVSFRQFFAILSAVDFKFTSLLKDFYGFTNGLIPVISDEFSIDCILNLDNSR